jgi:hypothetical protein
VADLNESVKIAEERTNHALKEMEVFADKNREHIHNVQQMKEIVKDKDLQI